MIFNDSDINSQPEGETQKATPAVPSPNPPPVAVTKKDVTQKGEG